MKETIDFTQVPHHYAICLNQECSLANHCLRQLVEQSLPDNVQHWLVINPKYQAAQEGSCTHFRSATKVKYAKGFSRILNDLPNRQMQEVTSRLISFFGQRTYYRVRKGERLMTTAEQQHFLYTLRKCGVTSSPEFDAYVEEYDW